MQVIDERLLRTAIAANVVRLRRAQNLSQAQLADRAGVSRVTMNRIEKSRGTPQTPVLFALADALGVPADSLRQVADVAKSA